MKSTILSYLKNTLQLILAPKSGWEDVSVSTDDTEELVSRYMYPTMALAGLSHFVGMCYEYYMPFGTTLIEAIVISVSLVITYFFARLMFDHFMYRFCEQEPTTHKMTTVLAYTMSLLSLATVLRNIIPVGLGLKYLLPLGVAMIVWRANVYLKVRQDMDLFFIFFVIAVAILPPLLIQQFFDLFI